MPACATPKRLWLTGTRFTAGPPDAPTGPAEMVLHQLGDACFAPVGGFTYTTADGTRRITVDPTTLPTTDLTSVPVWLQWFVSRHGRHTPAVLVHDQMVPADLPRTRAGYDLVTDANRVFLEAMDDTDVPPVRKRLLWAGVVLATRTLLRPWGLAGVIAWAFAALAGVILLGLGLYSWSPVLVVVALAGPVPASLLLGRQTWVAGLILGYALPLLFLPAAASFVGWVCYWLLEQVVTRLSRGRSAPEPVGFKEA